MTYQGDNIGDKPTLDLIEIYISEKGYFCEPQKVYDYWERKNWVTKKGTPLKTLENCIDVYNSIFVQRERRKLGNGNKKRRKCVYV